MLSHKLVASIEGHSEQLAAVVIDRIQRDPDLVHMAKLEVAELRDIGSALLRNLGDWLAGHEREIIARHYEQIGRKRSQQGIPLHECVRSLHILRSATIEYARGQGFPQTSLEIYAEEELEHRLTALSDFLVYHLVRGYEEALRSEPSSRGGSPAVKAASSPDSGIWLGI
jgi:hypothetical protein